MVFKLTLEKYLNWYHQFMSHCMRGSQNLSACKDLGHHMHPRTGKVAIMLLMLMQSLGVRRQVLFQLSATSALTVVPKGSFHPPGYDFLICSLAMPKYIPWHPAVILSYRFSSLRWSSYNYLNMKR